ncbi:MAG: DNA double-strand break repair nuclease NurA [Candidatus Anstonellaceae archaeon]
MLEWLDHIARKIEQSESSRAELAKRLRFNSGKVVYPETLEENLFYPVSPIAVQGKIAAVDSSIAGEELHGFDFLLMRCIGVVFDYRDSRVAWHGYFPSAHPPFQYDAKSGLDNYEVMWHKSLFRLKGELSCATQLIEKHSPSALLLDGSIAPLLSDKPSEESEMSQLYQEVLDTYKKLYKCAWASNCTLLGIIKDSRSKRFIEILGKHVKGEEGLAHTTDSNFLFFLLQEGERTCAFTYSSYPSKHQILKDLGEWSEKILSFYIKPVKEDRPLRVEFLSGQRTFEEIAGLVYSLAKIHKAYAYPAILIEADLRAALDDGEFERAYSSLFSRLARSPSLLRLRRNSRPFR